jgi:hypothetical protein
LIEVLQKCVKTVSPLKLHNGRKLASLEDKSIEKYSQVLLKNKWVFINQLTNIVTFGK